MNQRKFVVNVAAYALFSLFSPFVANGACHLNEIETNCTFESTYKAVALEEKTLYICSSPDGKIKLELCKSEQGSLTYLIKMDDATLITHSKIGYALQDGSIIPGENWKVTEQETRSVNSLWKPLWGKREVVNDCFNELSLTIAGDSKSAVKELNLLIRLYNEGVAFKYQLPQGEPNSSVLLNEVTEFNFAEDFTAWFYNFEYHNIGPERLTESNGERFPVMTVKACEDKYLAIHEAYLQGGLPLVLESNKGETLFKVKTGEQEFLAGEESAWRVILMGRTVGSLVDSHLIELLNPEPDSSMDFTWVKPGVSLWDWRIDGAIVDDFTYTMTYPSWV
ncbi:MAG: glycoside hydrolase family 97 N-terminal domain-containing protein, partial [Phocaeicola sp.]